MARKKGNRGKSSQNPANQAGRGGGPKFLAKGTSVQGDTMVNRPSQPANLVGDWVEVWTNEKFEEYYKKQQLFDADEWERFLGSMRQTLPTTFRLPAGKSSSPILADIIETLYVPALSNITFEGVRLDPPVKVPWYPEGLAYQLNANKRVIRKSPEFKKFHQFLVYETNVGNISRQEAVSMIPPLLLDVQPHHVVLDTCASPGSKTAQLIEYIHASGAPIPTGMVIANDSDYTRAGMLVHQAARLPSPALMVTNLDASCYPNLQVNDPENPSRTKTLLFDRILCDVPCSGDGTLRKNVGIWKHWSVGSGNALHSLQLRILQRAMRILKPGCRLVYSTCSLNPVENEAVIAAALNSFQGQFKLLPTNSMLPNLLRRPGLTSWTPALPFSHQTGRGQPKSEETPDADAETSVVAEKSGELMFFPSYEVYASSPQASTRVSKTGKPQLVETHWPPSNVSELGLEHCMRIYPQLQDTGGFFVAVLQKVDDTDGDGDMSTSMAATEEPTAVPLGVKRAASEEDEIKASAKKPKLVDQLDEDAAPEEVMDEQPDQTKQKVKKQRQPGKKGKHGRGSNPEGSENVASEGVTGLFKEHPYTYLNPQDEALQQSLRRLSLSPSFPSQNLFVRNPSGEPTRMLYLSNDLVKQVVSLNSYERIRLVSCGVKLFGRQDVGPKNRLEEQQVDETLAVSLPQPSEAEEKVSPGVQLPSDRRNAFRFVFDGVTTVEKFVESPGRVKAGLKELRRLLETFYPLTASFDEPFKTALESKAIGSYLIDFQPGELQDASLRHPLLLPLWKSGTSLSLMIDKQAKSALSIRLWGEDCTMGTVKPIVPGDVEMSNEMEQEEGGGRDEAVEDAPLLD